MQAFYWIGAYFCRLMAVPHLKGSQTDQQIFPFRENLESDGIEKGIWEGEESHFQPCTLVKQRLKF